MFLVLPNKTKATYVTAKVYQYFFQWQAFESEKEKLVLRDGKIIGENLRRRQNKTKMVAWFVSNCNSWNKRLDYAQRLAKYIQVTKYPWDRDRSKCAGRHLRKVRQPNLPAWQCKLFGNAGG